MVHDLLNRYPSIINQLELNYNPIFFGMDIKPFIRSLKEKSIIIHFMTFIKTL